MYHENVASIPFDTYVYIAPTGGQTCIDISMGGGEIFELPERIITAYPDVPTLSGSVFLWMFVIRKYLQDMSEGGECPALSTPIVLDLEDEHKESIESVKQVRDGQQPMEISDLLAFLNTNNTWVSETLRKSLRLFGVSFSIEDTVSPVLGFDVFDNGTNIVSSAALLKKYAGCNELSNCLMTYIFALTSISFSEIDAINAECAAQHLLLVNSTLDHSITTADTEHADSIYKLGNKQCGQLLAQLGGSRADDKKHSRFTDIVKLYSLLEEQDSEVCISYNDFADHTFVNSNTSEVGMTEGQLRALALFHLQHPDNPIDFESMPLKQQADYCRFVADLADRKEGTLSDRLLALHSKRIGSLYTITTASYKRHFVRLDAIKLSSSNAINNDSIQLISLPITKLASCIKFVDNRPTVTLKEQVYYDPLPYGENPFDYRPDFVIDPLAAAPKLHKLTCVGSNFYCDYKGDFNTQSAISILSVLPTLMQTDILKPIMQAELLDFADYGSMHNYDLSDDKADLSMCRDVPVSVFGAQNNNASITPTTVGRTIQEKSFIVHAFVHRLLRYFESVMQEQSDDIGIKRRILSLADLLCYEDNGVVYVGVADQFDSAFEVTPLSSTITIDSERRYSGATDEDFSSAEDCIMVFPKRIVSSITPTTIFNRKTELPAAVRAIVAWLNNNSGSVTDTESHDYEWYVSYGLQFDSWDAYLVMQSCSAAGALSSDVQTFFGKNNKNYATVTSGCEEDIHAAYLEYRQGIISRDEYIARTQRMCELYVSSILTIPLYSLEFATERNILCDSPEIIKRIDFRFFKNVRLQYSPITIFGTWSAQRDNVTWHVSLLN